MLFAIPFALSEQLQARAVDEQVHGTMWDDVRRAVREAAASPAQGGVVRNREVQPEQAEQAGHEPFGLAQGQMEDEAQHQHQLDCQVRVDAMGAARGLAQSSLEATDGAPHAKAERLEQISCHL